MIINKILTVSYMEKDKTNLELYFITTAQLVFYVITCKISRHKCITIENT